TLISWPLLSPFVSSRVLPPRSTLFPYTTLFRSCRGNNLKSVDLSIPTGRLVCISGVSGSGKSTLINDTLARAVAQRLHRAQTDRSEEHTSELQSRFELVCRPLLEKKKKIKHLSK